jgi:hypothetical protein
MGKGKHRRTEETAPDGSPMSEKVKTAKEFDKSVKDSEERPTGYTHVGNITVAPVRRWGGK